MKLGKLLLGGALVVASATLASAEVNCKQVKKYLDTGRSVKDVAETMVISEADVKKYSCFSRSSCPAGVESSG